MKMPFGKYRGDDLDSIPKDYLVWLLDTVDLGPYLRMEVERLVIVNGGRDDDKYEQGRRDGYAAGHADGWRAGHDAAGLAVKQWYREASIQLHPDHGGDCRLMAIVNQLRDRLLNMR
jgi:hypothetical protein